ncbi:MAG: hypothetical protein KIT09_11995 [Bryobacteraceae bacterium]|nr:hypothetical protein [Bryobacteraceae bacterium]
MPAREAYTRSLQAAGIHLAPQQPRRGVTRASAFVVAASWCGSAAAGAALGCLVTGHPPWEALSWFGRGSAETGALLLTAATLLLHWPFKWAIEQWW